MESVRLVFLVALAALAQCGGKIPTETGDAATSDAGRTPATCSWSSSFEPLDAEPMRDSCRAARMLVTCTGSDGSDLGCMSDEEKCPISGNPGVTYTCKSQCKSTEFAAKCGTLMGSSVVPPGDCAVKLTSPGGPFYCCACSM